MHHVLCNPLLDFCVFFCSGDVNCKLQLNLLTKTFIDREGKQDAELLKLCGAVRVVYFEAWIAYLILGENESHFPSVLISNHLHTELCNIIYTDQRKLLHKNGASHAFPNNMVTTALSAVVTSSTFFSLTYLLLLTLKGFSHASQ